MQTFIVKIAGNGHTAKDIETAIWQSFTEITRDEISVVED